MTEQFAPELGQMVFGNPTSELAAPEFIEAGLNHLATEIERVEWNRTQEQFDAPTGNSGTQYATDVFSMRSYYWGECECGWVEKDFDEPHDADCYQTALGSLFDAVGKGSDDYDNESVYRKITEQFGLPMQGCAVHCTCTHERRFAEWFEREKLGPQGHAADCPSIIPNFKCGDFEVRWYKWVGRGTSMNRPIDANEFFQLIDKCIASVRATEPDDGEPF